MRGAVKRSFAETAKKGNGILNVLELSDSIKGATTEQPYRHAHSFPNRLTLNKSPFHPVHAVVFFRSARTIIGRSWYPIKNRRGRKLLFYELDLAEAREQVGVDCG